jgi:hypothetical protein
MGMLSATFDGIDAQSQAEMESLLSRVSALSGAKIGGSLFSPPQRRYFVTSDPAKINGGPKWRRNFYNNGVNGPSMPELGGMYIDGTNQIYINQRFFDTATYSFDGWDKIFFHELVHALFPRISSRPGLTTDEANTTHFFEYYYKELVLAKAIGHQLDSSHQAKLAESAVRDLDYLMSKSLTEKELSDFSWL